MINIVITGANGELGVGIIRRLIEKATEPTQIYVGVRNNKKFEYCADQVVLNLAIRDVVKLEDKLVSLIPWICSVETVEQVKSATTELIQKVDHVDYLYLNAGAIFSKGIDIPLAIKIFLTDFKTFFTNPPYIQHDNSQTTSDNISRYFAVNVFGHYLLSRMVEDLMLKAENPKVIWTTSAEALPQFFNIDDIQCQRGENPYGSSKYVVNQASAHLNQRYQFHKMPIRSYLGDPATVPSSLAGGMVGDFIFTYAARPFMLASKWLLNLDFIHYDGYQAAFALAYIVEQADLSTDSRYKSFTNRDGISRVEETPMNEITDDEHIKRVGDYLDRLITELAPN